MKKILVVVLGAVVLLGIAFVVDAGVKYFAAAAEFERAKTALVLEARGFCWEAERNIASDWRSIAQDYLSDFERGRLEETYRHGYQDYLGNRDHAVLAAEAYRRVRRAVEKQLAKEGDYPITDDKVQAVLDEDARIVKLREIGEASHAVYLCARELEEIETAEDLDRFQMDYEQKKKELVHLLKSRA